jgi:hypothetical protein
MIQNIENKGGNIQPQFVISTNDILLPSSRRNSRLFGAQFVADTQIGLKFETSKCVTMPNKRQYFAMVSKHVH